MSEDEFALKPCPCCGGHATMEHGAERSDNGWVVCMECGLSTRYHHDPAEAAAEWNRRACDAHHETPSTVHNGDCVPQTERNAAHKTVDDVIESMERFANRHWMHDEGQSVREFAARLKAALKRERAEIEAQALSVGGVVEAARHTPGNAAATREALARIVEFAKAWADPGADAATTLGLIIDKAESALSAPERNCDKMPDIDNLTMHDLAKSPCKSTLEYASREELLALVRWILSPAADRKGDGDGR